MNCDSCSNVALGNLKFESNLYFIVEVLLAGYVWSNTLRDVLLNRQPSIYVVMQLIILMQ